MPSPLSGDYTLKQLIQNTYHHKPSRIETMERDVLKSIIIEKVTVYDGKAPGKARTTYRIRSRSYPQYWPYYTKKDRRGRQRRYQRAYRHQYEIILQVDRLSINVPFKARTGSQAAWDKNSKTRRDNRGRVIESDNYKKGINPDFLFRLEYLYSQHGILYGRNRAKYPPNQTNPNKIVFADKHLLRVIKELMNRGILKDD